MSEWLDDMNAQLRRAFDNFDTALAFDEIERQQAWEAMPWWRKALQRLIFGPAE